MTTIKFSAGDNVFWLSPNGFKSGIVKTVLFEDRVTNVNFTYTQSRTKYYLWCEEYPNIYIGDCIDEKLIFVTKEEMIEYYSKMIL